MIFLTLLLFPILIALGFFFFGKHHVTWQEFLAHVVAQCIVAGASVFFIYHSNISDVEIWNGHITKKEKERVSCSHSYSCNCYTTCSTVGKTQSCTRHCSTCYEHSYDIDWAYYSTDDGRNTIDRIDRRGLNKPSRWDSVVIGEPSSSTHRYDNYIKGSPDTLFRQQGLVEKYKKTLPSYPGKIRDYYKINRIVGNVKDKSIYNQKLSEINSRLGRKKQVNMVLVVVDKFPQEYFYALEQHWLGGKKNDAILVVGVDGDNIIWSSVMAWTDSEIFKIKLRDSTVDLKKLDVDRVLEVFAFHVETYYKRKPMKDFKYLTSSITPSVTEWIVSMLVGCMISIGLGIFFVMNEDHY